MLFRSYEVKVGISNVRPAGTIAGSEYGDFDVVIRYVDQTKVYNSPFTTEDEDLRPNVVETFKCNLDPNSPNYISRVIGDRKRTIASNGKVTENGDWVNNSKYIRIKNVNENAPVQAIPFAHAAYKLFVRAGAQSEASNATTFANYIPRVTFSTASVTDSTKMSGIDLDNNADNKIYMKPIPNSAGNGSNSVFSLDTICGLDLSLTTSTEIAKRQFVVAFQEEIGRAHV